MTFDTLGLRPESLRAIADQGYTEPTPVQAQAIPLILEGHDVLAGAQTGTGKTAAFVLPMLQTLRERRPSGPRRVRGLVVVPTRELALQVEQSIRTYGAQRPMRSTAIYGGVRMDRQVRALRHGVDIIVATPGRLLDHLRQGTVDLSGIEILVLDEADRMLDMGFIHDIKRILECLPTERQSLLFSATFSPKIRRLAEDLLSDPRSIDVAPRNTAAAPIRQVVHPVDKGRKRHLLSHMVRTKRVDQVLVFTRTKRGANRLAEQLGKDGIGAVAIHGNKSQSQRVRALTAFKQGRSQVLVATDVAARGLDIESLPHVVNYELPTVPEDYVHRIGRTGRAGQEGTAISLVAADERELMAGIEKLLKRPLEREVVEGFEPSHSSLPEPIITRGQRQQKHRGGNSHPNQGHHGKSSSPRKPRSMGSNVGSSNGHRHDGQNPGSHRAMPGERLAGTRPTSSQAHGNGSGQVSGRSQTKSKSQGSGQGRGQAAKDGSGNGQARGHIGQGQGQGQGQGRRRRRGGPNGPARRGGSKSRSYGSSRQSR